MCLYSASPASFDPLDLDEVGHIEFHANRGERLFLHIRIMAPATSFG
jgi:hypothetical protein